VGADKRVVVSDGSAKTYLGEGTILGAATVYIMRMPDGSLCSLKDAGTRPSDELLSSLDATLEVVENNPKIRLDSGRIVYGCQVWWAELRDEGPWIVWGGRAPEPDHQIGPEYATRREAQEACTKLWADNPYDVAHTEVRRGG
jgi:hypothetical protein